MSCRTCNLRMNTVHHERNYLAKYARQLSRRKDDPTPTQLAEIAKTKSRLAQAERAYDEHLAECNA